MGATPGYRRGITSETSDGGRVKGSPIRSGVPESDSYLFTASRPLRVWVRYSSRQGHRKRIVAGADREDDGLALHALEADPGGLVQGVAAFRDSVRGRCREEYLRRRVGRNGDIEEELAIFHFPIRGNQAVDAAVGDRRRRDFIVQLRRDENLFVGWGGAADAADILDHPLIDGAEGVVRKGVHPRILETLLRCPPIPALPDARRALLDGEAPRREGLVVQQTPGDVGPANLREDLHQVFGADEAGGEMPAALLDVRDEVLGGLLCLIALH